MREIEFQVRASTRGEAYRIIATGIRPEGGGVLLSPSEAVPSDLTEAFNRFLTEFPLSIGTWDHKIGDTNYKIDFRFADVAH